jgi:hypothetical protein
VATTVLVERGAEFATRTAATLLVGAFICFLVVLTVRATKESTWATGPRRSTGREYLEWVGWPNEKAVLLAGKLATET